MFRYVVATALCLPCSAMKPSVADESTVPKDHGDASVSTKSSSVSAPDWGCDRHWDEQNGWIKSNKKQSADSKDYDPEAKKVSDFRKFVGALKEKGETLYLRDNLRRMGKQEYYEYLKNNLSSLFLASQLERHCEDTALIIKGVDKSGKEDDGIININPEGWKVFTQCKGQWLDTSAKHAYDYFIMRGHIFLPNRKVTIKKGKYKGQEGKIDTTPNKQVYNPENGKWRVVLKDMVEKWDLVTKKWVDTPDSRATLKAEGIESRYKAVKIARKRIEYSTGREARLRSEWEDTFTGW